MTSGQHVSDRALLDALATAYAATDRTYGATAAEIAAHCDLRATTVTDRMTRLIDDDRVAAAYLPLDHQPERVYRPA